MNFGNKLKQLKYENLKVFIRSDVHAVRAGIKLKGSRPLTTPGFIDRLPPGRKCSGVSFGDGRAFRIFVIHFIW